MMAVDQATEPERALDVLRHVYREARAVRDQAETDMIKVTDLARAVSEGTMTATFAIARCVQDGLIELAGEGGAP